MTHYEILELKPDCSIEDVKASYKRLAKILHPDKSTGSHEKFIALQESYDFLLKHHKDFEGSAFFTTDNIYLLDNEDIMISFTCNGIFAIKDISTPFGGTWFTETNMVTKALIIERSILVDCAYSVKLQVYSAKDYPNNNFVEYIQLPDRRTVMERLKSLFN